MFATVMNFDRRHSIYYDRLFDRYDIVDCEG
jgi:hypothetical protein